ncbi:endonuclease/exonuclease/phosphatase family protein [Glaciecola sp. 1036]|uniref:endonuclease/exonuclease/phosphatase family protein n=1 Tax=Alteromonadaceae TaxID=72275 RepID=UPI003CFD541F
MRVVFLSLLFLLFQQIAFATEVRVAAFNVSMEATNYQSQETEQSIEPSQQLLQHLKTGEHQQIKNIAEIIQRVRPDIILLNEFDYYADVSPSALSLFVTHYLQVSQSGQAPIDYQYQYIAPVNTGEPTPFDLDNDGKASGNGADAYGYGLYPGHYGMALLSRYPIKMEDIRTFQYFRWVDMPGALKPVDPSSEQPWYNDEEWQAMRLSSKSHWDIPIEIDGKTVHVLAMHPTPPGFDGPEDRNGKRNHDEIRLMADYLTADSSSYIYDDKKAFGGIKGQRFVLVGDFNAADIGDKHRPGVIEQLTEHPLVDASLVPTSKGGANASEEEFSNRYTAYWGARADYVLPSAFGFKAKDAGVFWPEQKSSLYRLVKDRKSSSDHRLVWMDLILKDD